MWIFFPQLQQPEKIMLRLLSWTLNLLYMYQFSSVESLSHVWLFVTPWTAAQPGFPVYHQLLELLKLMSIESVMPSIHLILCSPLLLLPSVFLSIMVFTNESILPNKLQHQSFQWIFRTDFLYDWLAWSPCSPRDSQASSPTQQFKSIDSLAFSVFLWPNSHPYMMTGKTIALTRWIFVSKVIFLLFNTLSRLAIA